MARKEEAAGAGGQRGGLPRCAVGSEVEVRMTDRGFHGAYYEAIVTARLPGSGGYEVVYSTLVEDGGGGPLRETAAIANVRPRPPPAPGTPWCDLNVFDMVEAYHNDGWWPGVVSGAWPASTAGEPRYAVSFPSVPEVVKLPASLVRPRRAFVRGRWMDAQEVVPRVPLYDEGSNVEVIWGEGKLGTTWMTATIVKMIGSTNYVVRHGNSKGSIVVLHSRYIRPQPIFDRMKFDYHWEPSAAVEVYHDGTWSPGVISDIGSCGSSKYAVRIKRHNSADEEDDEEDYTLVSSKFLRPCCIWDGQEWRVCSTKKHARKRKYTVSVENSLSPVFSTPGRDSDQNSSVPNKRARTDYVRNEEPHMRHSLYPSQVTTLSSSKLDIDIEAPSDKHGRMKRKLEGRECIWALSTLPKLSSHGVMENGNCLMKTFASTRGNGKSSFVEVVEISDNSGYSDVIEISDNSSCNPNRRKKRRQNPQEEGLHSRHIVHPNQESSPTSDLPLAQNSPSNQNLLLAVVRHPEVQPCNDVLPTSVALLELSWAPSNEDGVQLTPVPGYPVLGMQPLQGFPGMNETKEPPLSDHVHSEAELMAPDGSTARDENQEMCQEVRKVKSWVADDCNRVADTSLITSENSKQIIVDRSHGEANSMRQRSKNSKVPVSWKIGPSSSVQQSVKFLSSKEMEVPEGHINTPDATNITGISPKKESRCNSEILMNCKPCQNSEGSKLWCIKTTVADDCNRVTDQNDGFLTAKIPDVSRSEFSLSSQHMLGQCQVPISWRPAGPSSFVHPAMTMDLSAFMPAPNSSTLPPELVTSSLLLRPHEKMEVFTRLPQNPHFHELLQDCHPEFREGKALGLMVAFANLAESIKNMRIEDEDQLFQGKLSSLSELEENGFEVGGLKARLENLLCIKNRQMDLKDKKASLEQDILEKEVANSKVEQQLTVLDVGIKELERMLFRAQEEKASLVAQKTANYSEISKLRVDVRGVEELFMFTEGDFNSTAAAPW